MSDFFYAVRLAFRGDPVALILLLILVAAIIHLVLDLVR